MVNDMKKSKKLFLWGLLLILCASLGIYFLIRLLNNPSRLTPVENEWINSNLNKVQNVSVINDTNVFGVNGTGVFYDFINDFSNRYGLKVNAITYNTGETATGIAFGIANRVTDDMVNFYQDHYILVSKTNDLVTYEADLLNKRVGITADNVNYVQEQLEVIPSFVTYNSRDELIQALDNNEISSMIVPRMEFMDMVLSKNYFVVYHFSNIFRYYNLILDKQTEPQFSSVLQKYFQRWEVSDFASKLHQQEFQMFVQNLNISQAEIDRLQSVVYNYGFINNHPYEILSGGNYGGVIATYLSNFSSFSNIEFNFKRFKSYKKLVSDINDNKIDLSFGYYNFTGGGSEIPSNLLLQYDILAPAQNNIVITSLKSLKDQTIYVQENSLLFSRLNAMGTLSIQTYENEKDLKNLIKQGALVVMDHNVSNYYQKNLLKDYSVRFQGDFNLTYSFKAQSNDTFVKLFTKYIDYMDENKMISSGIYNHSVTLRNGTILGTIAKYFLYIMAVVLVTLYLIYRSSKRVRLANKIRREDKMKFIDQLTSLKNRNYLNENIEKWNKNTIYPQSMIVIDLNRVQDINDTVSYEQGDAQIKAAANVLIKTQLDNSDIMRTDGNEFMIYLIGYQAKQISSFIHKLNKEFKNLPYSYGAAIGYSMIVDDIKSIEDAINEAIEDVRKQKNAQKEEQDS